MCLANQLVNSRKNASTDAFHLALKLMDDFFSKEKVSNSNCMEDEEESAFNNILLMVFNVSCYAFYNYDYFFLLYILATNILWQATNELEQRGLKIVLNKI